MSDKAVEFWKHFFAILVRHAASIFVVLTALAVFAQPWAEQFIRQTVAGERFVTERSLEQIEERIENLESSAEELKEQFAEQNQAQERINADLRFLKALQTEQRQDIKEILRGIDRLEN